MASRSTNFWMDFFLNSNLPQSVATKYAVIFTDHRIQENMLGDITKDMLYDMGIKTMGDVIAILKHAKEVNDEKIQFQLLGKSNFSQTNSKPKVHNCSINKEPISGPSVSSSTSGSSTSKRNSFNSEDNQGSMKVRRAKVTFNSIPSIKSNQSIRLGNTHQDSATRKISVFTRLGDNETPSSSSSSTLSSSLSSSSLNKLKVTSIEPKVTRIITGLNDNRPSKFSQPKSVKDRLGGNKVISGNSTRPIISSTIKPKQSLSQQSSRNKISLKKSIFDRLGTKSF
ncbi:uncharacterized protein C19orf47 homolog isoform X2 [Panonychus citri]|uniref:uncharacterized protein C19orf47 homolog isoform X2 n=1 Tax=Panonychus citri TaxID=50023 RepID=UPI002307CE55|nr:uncharacterized protein C19orf47 homolog isoform X2 [Panonychus citri]